MIMYLHAIFNLVSIWLLLHFSEVISQVLLKLQSFCKTSAFRKRLHISEYITKIEIQQLPLRYVVLFIPELLFIFIFV